MKRVLKAFFGAAFLLALLMQPFSAYAAAGDELKLAGWIPYWRTAEGIKDAKKHLGELDTVYPFGYSVKTNGKLNDLAKIKGSTWKKFISSAKTKNVEIIPTIMWSDTNAIHNILSNKTSRTKHIKYIADMVKRGKYAGVDIDYEGKKAETKEHYSAFLKELKAALGAKVLSCTIEARTPPDSLYTVVPADIKYANDYNVIGDVCDRVNIMAYDQGRADVKLINSKRGTPYTPVSDVDWVRKVIELTVGTIPREKIMLSVPTYGREYEITVSPNWYQNYRHIASLNPPYAVDTAEEYDITPSKNSGGELSFSYLPKTSSLLLDSSIQIPANTPTGNIVAARALAYANQTGTSVKFNYVTWSDAEAIEQKVNLANEFGLRGISIFKIDGSEDKDLWDLF